MFPGKYDVGADLHRYGIPIVRHLMLSNEGAVAIPLFLTDQARQGLCNTGFEKPLAEETPLGNLLCTPPRRTVLRVFPVCS